MEVSSLIGPVSGVLKHIPWRRLQRWAAARDLVSATGERFTIVVADLANDEGGAQARHVVRALRAFAGVAIYRTPKAIYVREIGDVLENLAQARAEARKLARRYNGDLVVWGEVVKADHLLHLRFTTREEDLTQEGEYTLDTQLRLPTNFGENLGSTIFVECVSRLLPSLEAASVGAAGALARETTRLKPLLADPAISSGDRAALARAFTMAALTLFECTGEAEWLSQALAIVEEPSMRGSLCPPSPDDLTFHARMWLTAADEFPLRALGQTGMVWLDRAVAASGQPTRLHWLLKAWALRLLSRHEEDPQAQAALIA